MIPTRNERIDEFLKHIAIIAKNNPNIFVMEDIIYRELENYGVQDEDEQKDIEHLFQSWTSYFSNRPNITAFVSPSWKYFCQFTNESYYNAISDKCDPVKIYVPLDSAHLDRGVQEIFSFLEREKISHHSKVAKKIRSDNVVIRVPNIQIANIIIDFINNNDYICESKIKTNPFCYDVGKCAVAIDGSLSYNDQVSKLIEQYMLEKRCLNDFESVSREDFFYFIKTHSFAVTENEREVHSLIIHAVDGRDEIKNYTKHYIKVSKKYKKNESEALYTDEDVKILDGAIIATIKNHGLLHGYGAIYKYLTTFNAESISKYDPDYGKNINFRTLLIRKVSNIKVFNIMISKVHATTNQIDLVTNYINNYIVPRLSQDIFLKTTEEQNKSR